jgi:predicted PurR-regulated permease PerM
MPSEVHKLSFLHVLASLVLVTASLYWARVVLVPLALALMLTFLLQPIVAALHRRGLGHTPAAVLVVVLLGLGLGAVGWVVIAQFSSLASGLPGYTENLKQKIDDLQGASRGGVFEQIQETIADLSREFEHNSRPTPASQEAVAVQTPGLSLVSYVPSFLGFLADAGLVLVLLLFMLIAHEDLRARLFRLIGYGRLIDTTKALDEAGQRISRSLLMQAIVNGTYGCAVGLGLFCLGLPYALLWGLLAAALRFIPYVGPAVGAVLPIALSLAVFAGWVKPLLVGGLFVLLELVTNMLLEPLLYGRSAGVSQVALLMAIAFWTWLWGPVGLLLATPLTVCLGVLGKYVPHLAFLEVLLSDEEVTELNRYYQRLLARDQDGAVEVVEELLQTQTLTDVYDAVLLPALYFTEQDQKRDNLTVEEARFIYQATSELVDNLGASQAATAVVAVPVAPEEDTASALPPKVRILACPAHDEADEVALQMFQHVLDPVRFEVEFTKTTLLTAQVLSLVEQTSPEIVCIGLVPPGGFAQTRYLCKRLRARFPALPIVIGCWGGPKDEVEHLARLRLDSIAHTSTTLLETCNQIMQLPQIPPPLVSQAVGSVVLGQTDGVVRRGP